ncbi:hypothetical protein COCOBI_07-4810 [Coccomyxa sp. Obi]|nr:hypothetical protein COCOBI_07-4810 [Coccomyxa sp. Obi]
MSQNAHIVAILAGVYDAGEEDERKVDPMLFLPCGRIRGAGRLAWAHLLTNAVAAGQPASCGPTFCYHSGRPFEPTTGPLWTFLLTSTGADL